MPYIDRDEAIKRIRTALKKKTGKAWSVTGGRGTGWGWITVQAPPKRRICHDTNPAWNCYDLNCQEPRYFQRKPENGETGWYTSDAECRQLKRAFKLDRMVNSQGILISPDSYEFYVGRAES